MAVFSLILFLPAFLLAMALSWHRNLGPLRASALNPMLVPAFFTVLFALDFASVAASGYGRLGGHIIRTDPATFTLLTAKFAGLLLAFLLGIAAGFSRRPSKPAPTAPVGMRTVLAIAYCVLLAVWFVAIASYSPDYFSLAGSVEAKLESTGDPVVYAISLLLLPALCYALARQPYRVTAPLVAISLAIVFFSGSRTRMLYALLPFFIYLVMVRAVQLRRFYFLVGIVVVGTLSVAALNVRILLSYGRVATADQVLDLGNFLNSNDVALAETSIVLSKMPKERTTPYPGESLVGVIAGPIPRAVAPFKPDPGSVQFTKAFDPQRWRASGSGLVIGAVNEIESDFPYPVALVLIWLIGAAWGLALVRALRSPSIHGFAGTVALYIFIYNFLRGDLFLAGSPLMVFVFYGALVEIYRRSKSGASAARTASVRTARPSGFG